jgi:hypothetical protein
VIGLEDGWLIGRKSWFGCDKDINNNDVNDGIEVFEFFSFLPTRLPDE